MEQRSIKKIKNNKIDMETFPHNETIDFSKKLNIKFGIDPTSDQLHLGHLIPLRLVKKLLNDGHNIDIILGTFTSQLGDPSGKDAMRPMIDSNIALTNAEKLLNTIKRILGDNFNVHLNHTWFENMSSIEMTKMLAKFTTSQLLSRDSFQKRLSNKDGIGMHELVVPILQGFDSVKLKTDVEIGGSDQLFNFGITRDLQKAFNQTPEKCILMPIINGTDGRKMSKSFGNCIFLNDVPKDVFGKVMSISDTLMIEWFKIIFDKLPEGNKMESKKQLAFEITKEIWNEQEAEIALTDFQNKIQNKQIPTDIIQIESNNLIHAVTIIRKCSISEAKRLMSQGGVSVNQLKVIENIDLKENDVIKIGKFHFGKIK